MSESGRPSRSDPPAELEGKRFAVVCSRFNPEVTDRLLAGALGCLQELGADPASLRVYRVPGAWELPQTVARIVGGACGAGGRTRARKFDAVIALGCVVRGETSHFDYVCLEASLGLGAVARRSPVPVAFGVLTAETLDQALARAGGAVGDKGYEAALAAVEMIQVFEAVDDGSSTA